MNKGVLAFGIIMLLVGVVLWLFADFFATFLGSEYLYRSWGFDFSFAGIVILVIVILWRRRRTS